MIENDYYLLQSTSNPTQVLLVSNTQQQAGTSQGTRQMLELHSPLGRSSSCSSASRRGLSSIAMRRQPSALSDSADREFVGRELHVFSPYERTFNKAVPCRHLCTTTTVSLSRVATLFPALLYRSIFQQKTGWIMCDQEVSRRLCLPYTSNTACHHLKQ